MTRLFLLMTLTMLGGSSVAWGGGLPVPEDATWTPIQDEVYLQEVGSIVTTPSPLLSVVCWKEQAFAGDATGVLKLMDDALQRVSGPTGPVTQFLDGKDALWAASPAGLWRYSGDQWSLAAPGNVLDLCRDKDRLVYLTDGGLFALVEGKAVALTNEPTPGLVGVAPYAGTLYVHDGRRIGLLQRGEIIWDYLSDWGRLEPGCTIRDMMAAGSRLIFATDEGLNVLRGMTWYRIAGAEGLCYEDTTCIARGFEDDLWIGTMRGAIRNVADKYQFFGHQRWIPHDKVNAIACGNKTVYIATDGGLGIITYEPYTLAKKAAYYERWLNEWGMKRLGFVHSLNFIDGEWLREVSDNDVGYSSHYMTSRCFEFAVTGSKEARAAAVDMMKSVKWSEEITSIDGFPARSIYAAGESTLKAQHGSGGLPAEWHPTPDGLWEWKGDTSSDETDAHVYETGIFLSLVANEEEKVWATEHLRRVMGHIVDNGFLLRDVDGQPTRWARWDPEYLQTPYGYYARGLNGLEAFNYMTTALHFTGDQKFAEGKQQLIGWNYFGDILRQKLTFHPGFFTAFDDRLAFYSYYSLVQYETDPDLEALWRRSLERSWEVKRIDGLPWFNFIYGALTGNDCEMDRSAAHLREWPLDLHKYSFTNSHRDDLQVPEGYTAYAERTKPLSPREIQPDRWDGNFMRLDGTLNGMVVADPGGWLDAYWMGRYYGMISAPKTEDKELKTVPERTVRFGAKPYSGPPRPKLSFER